MITAHHPAPTYHAAWFGGVLRTLKSSSITSVAAEAWKRTTAAAPPVSPRQCRTGFISMIHGPTCKRGSKPTSLSEPARGPNSHFDLQLLCSVCAPEGGPGARDPRGPWRWTFASSGSAPTPPSAKQLPGWTAHLRDRTREFGGLDAFVRIAAVQVTPAGERHVAQARLERGWIVDRKYRPLGAD